MGRSRGASGAVLLVAVFAALVLAERRRPLRRRVEPDRNRHDLRNLAVAAAGALAIRVLEKPVVEPLARAVERRRLGLVQALPIPPAARDALAVVLLDATLFLWHILTHRVPAIWRFHRVHHLDLDLTATTALRFHFGEFAISAPWRAAQVLLVGASPRALQLWQGLTLLSILFHHSNLRLPQDLDRALRLVVVTPRLHGIHHSDRADEMSRNWSSGLTLWDRLCGTYREDVPQEAITIGVPGCRRAVTVSDALTLPAR
jgi:sterol desaturase/sphingolipid hydroxylase (fatty acid hydroxylase superfamily)